MEKGGYAITGMAATKRVRKKTHTETIICDSHSEQAQYQETEHFKDDVASLSGLSDGYICSELQVDH